MLDRIHENQDTNEQDKIKKKKSLAGPHKNQQNQNHAIERSKVKTTS